MAQGSYESAVTSEKALGSVTSSIEVAMMSSKLPDGLPMVADPKVQGASNTVQTQSSFKQALSSGSLIVNPNNEDAGVPPQKESSSVVYGISPRGSSSPKGTGIPIRTHAIIKHRKPQLKTNNGPSRGANQQIHGVVQGQPLQQHQRYSHIQSHASTETEPTQRPTMILQPHSPSRPYPLNKDPSTAYMSPTNNSELAQQQYQAKHISAVFASRTRRPMFDQKQERHLITNKLSSNYQLKPSPKRTQRVKETLISDYFLEQTQTQSKIPLPTEARLSQSSTNLLNENQALHSGSTYLQPHYHLESAETILMAHTDDSMMNRTRSGRMIRHQVVPQLRQNELEEMQSGLEPGPGPGSYGGLYERSSFASRPQVQMKHQRMAQVKPRWQERDKRMHQDTLQVGPGFYEIHHGIPLRRKSSLEGTSPNQKVAPSFGKERRFPEQLASAAKRRLGDSEDSGAEEDDQVPGPGAYENNTPYLIHQSFNKGKVKGQFGSGTKRFSGGSSGSFLVKKDAEKLPGPGQYQPEVSQEFLDNKKSEIMPKSAVFMKKTPRDIGIYTNSSTVKEDRPGVGAYNPNHGDEIGVKYAKKLKESQSKQEFKRHLSVSSFALSQNSPSAKVIKHMTAHSSAQAARQRKNSVGLDQTRSSLDSSVIINKNPELDRSVQKLSGSVLYNTIEEDRIRRKYLNKHDKLLPSQALQRSSLVKVGKNLIKANIIVPEYKETQQRLKDQFAARYEQQSSTAKGMGPQTTTPAKITSPGPGQYGSIRDWKHEGKRKSFNLKYF